MEYVSLFVKSIFVDNMIFAYFLGMCSYLAVSKNVKTANGLGLAVIFVLLFTLPINWALNTFVLQPGALKWLGPNFADVDLSFLSFIIFIAVIAAFTQLVEMTRSSSRTPASRPGLRIRETRSAARPSTMKPAW